MSRPQELLANLVLSSSHHSQHNFSSPTTHQRNRLKVVELEHGAQLAEAECTRNALRKHMILGYGWWSHHAVHIEDIVQGEAILAAQDDLQSSTYYVQPATKRNDILLIGGKKGGAEEKNPHMQIWPSIAHSKKQGELVSCLKQASLVYK